MKLNSCKFSSNEFVKFIFLYCLFFHWLFVPISSKYYCDISTANLHYNTGLRTEVVQNVLPLYSYIFHFLLQNFSGGRKVIVSHPKRRLLVKWGCGNIIFSLKCCEHFGILLGILHLYIDNAIGIGIRHCPLKWRHLIVLPKRISWMRCDNIKLCSSVL